MRYTPTCICPNCNKEMVIAGTQCPYCEFSFTREVVDRFIFSCLKCRSRIIIINMLSDRKGGISLTVQNSKYYAIVKIAESAIASKLKTSYECGNCGHTFDCSSFLLQEACTQASQGQNEESTDSYGNKVVYKHYEDGTTRKITYPSCDFGYFEFLGDTYSKDMLKRCEDVKIYYRDNSTERVLKRDCYGRLLLYFYDDWGTASNDRIDKLWKVVANEDEADEFVESYRLHRLQEPYIADDGYGWMVAHELI